MKFRVAPDAYQKLSLLGDATRFEPAGGDPVTEAAETAAPSKGKPLPCISDVSTPKGKKPILKAMMTTACERNCNYCPFRAGRNQARRITFQPDEMAGVFNKMQQAGLVDGLFLSSGIIKGGVSTQDRLIDAAEILRSKFLYRGYIHLKIMPGAEYDQILRAMQLADRVSINLEGATPKRLEALAPAKDYWQELITRMRWIEDIRRQRRLSVSSATQFVVGVVGDTDLELLQVSETLYAQMGLRRAYYSAFSPVAGTPFEERAAVAPMRQFRLYQASFLLRDYGWSVEDLPFDASANLPLNIDPKLAWAQEHLLDAPLEVNRASRRELLQVPGIGPVTADAIVKERRRGRLSDITHLRAIGVRRVERVAPFVLLDGHRPPVQMRLLK